MSAETHEQRDARIRDVLQRAEQVCVQVALAYRLGDLKAYDLWSARFYDLLQAGLGVKPGSDAGRAIALLLMHHGWYTAEADRLLAGLERIGEPS